MTVNNSTNTTNINNYALPPFIEQDHNIVG